MAADESSSLDINDHCTMVDSKRNRFACNHCSKEVSGRSRVKYHLAGIRGDVTPCLNVPLNVKEWFYKELILLKQVQQKMAPLSFASDSLKRKCPTTSDHHLEYDSSEGEEDLPSIFHHLEVKLKETLGYVREVMDSWPSRGCSILVDAWRDRQGRDLVSFVVDCPCGPIYLHSFDASSLNGDSDALHLMLTKVVSEVGEDNVLQIIACSTTGWLGNVGDQFMRKCPTVFWIVSASHCIDLMLERITKLEHVQVILKKAKDVSKIFKSCGARPSFIRPKLAAEFYTLDHVISERKRLEFMVNDPSFWNGATMVLKAIIPLFGVLTLIHGDKLQVGHIYEIMDKAKKKIREELGSDDCIPFLEIIDEIWESYLHNPLHAAGYYLNPSIFYSTDFKLNDKVGSGILCCIVRMFRDHPTQDLIAMQIDKYRLSKGAFEEGSTAHRRNMNPVNWWVEYGGECPELQKFAIRILSQTCDGVTRCRLRRQMAGKVFTVGRECGLQSPFHHLAFLHYNLQLHYMNRGFTADGVSSFEELDPRTNICMMVAERLSRQDSVFSMLFRQFYPKMYKHIVPLLGFKWLL